MFFPHKVQLSVLVHSLRFHNIVFSEKAVKSRCTTVIKQKSVIAGLRMINLNKSQFCEGVSASFIYVELIGSKKEVCG